MTTSTRLVPDGDNQSKKCADPSAAHYDLLIAPLVETLRDKVTVIGAEMVLSVAGSRSDEVECRSGMSILGDGDMLKLARSIAAPPGRARSKYHLLEAARLIAAASKSYLGLKSFINRSQARAILQTLKVGWWHLRRAGAYADDVPLVDLRRSCCSANMATGRI